MIASLYSRKDLGGGLVEVALESHDLANLGYRRIGQYTRIESVGNSAYFFLAGMPSDPIWRFVLKPKGLVAEQLANAPIGTAFEVSPAMSEGFAWESIVDLNLALLLVGSGFGAAFSVLGKRRAEATAHRSRLNTRLYLGVADVSEPPAPAFLEEQRAHGVEVFLCTLEEQSREPMFPAIHGAMEQAFVDSIQTASEPWGAIVVGPNGLVQRLRESQAGTPALKHVLTNT